MLACHWENWKLRMCTGQRPWRLPPRPKAIRTQAVKFIYYYFLLLLLLLLIFLLFMRPKAVKPHHLLCGSMRSLPTLPLLPGLNGHPRTADSRDGPVAASWYQLLARTELISRQKSIRKPNFGTFGPITIYIFFYPGIWNLRVKCSEWTNNLKDSTVGMQKPKSGPAANKHLSLFLGLPRTPTNVNDTNKILVRYW